MTQCRAIEEQTARMRIGLMNRPVLRILWFSLKALKALNISIITRTERDRVEALALPAVK